jgi:hypothetical protein
MNEGIKVGFLGVLLVGVFALPTLTATQLVSVLGEKSVSGALKITPTSGKDLVVTAADGSYTISYFAEGDHSLFLVENPSTEARSVRVTPTTSSDSALLSQVVSLTDSRGNYPLFDHSVQPAASSYEITIPAGKSSGFKISVAADPKASGYGTVRIDVRGL